MRTQPELFEGPATLHEMAELLVKCGGEDNMTTSRIKTAAIALSIAFGFVAGAGSMQGPAKDQKFQPAD